MTDLSNIAKDVAEALGLNVGEFLYFTQISKNSGELSHSIEKDGSNLTDPYWRCRCEDWLLEQGWEFTAGFDGFHETWRGDTLDADSAVSLRGPTPWPEAPVRLVSVVWRKRNGD